MPLLMQLLAISTLQAAGVGADHIACHLIAGQRFQLSLPIFHCRLFFLVVAVLVINLDDTLLDMVTKATFHPLGKFFLCRFEDVVKQLEKRGESIYYLLREQRVAGSNPVIPTIKYKGVCRISCRRLFSL